MVFKDIILTQGCGLELNGIVECIEVTECVFSGNFGTALQINDTHNNTGNWTGLL